ncbi:hypothetical protein [Luteimonas fraxinea]|uniref:hypothetical protein n=1 Tax=Luteimonas fraxinea TaxID=2901869 RepID=UPI001E484537|nr:hypothetical protein [Luteimonas fraxinea]MCD9125864.1 hypothetical protein [Luteimonas fraxinea]
MVDFAHLAALTEAVREYGGVWPAELTSGIMFRRGQTITRQQFERMAASQREGRSHV